MSKHIVRPWPVRGARGRLVCFPYAGRGASMFYSWGEQLRERGIEVLSVQLPGRENRFMEPAFRSIGPVVESVVGAVRPYLDMPFGVFGHSLGAIVGFEMCRGLRRNELPNPDRLIVSGSRPPHLARVELLSGLPDDEFIRAVGKKYKGLPEGLEAEPELLSVVIPALRGDFSILESYQVEPEAPLDCKLAVFGGKRDLLVSHAELQCWGQYSRHGASLHMFPGEHFFIHSAERDVLATVQFELEERWRI